MTRIRKIVYLSLACTLSIVIVSCATSPPVRKIPQEEYLNALEKQKLNKEKSNADQLILWANKLLNHAGPEIGEPFRYEMITAIKSLREAMEGNNRGEIRDKSWQLYWGCRALDETENLINITTELLSTIGDDLSKDFKDQIRAKLVALQQARKFDKNDKIVEKYSALHDFRWEKFRVVIEFQEALRNQAKIDNLSPALKNQFRMKTEPMQKAMRGNSWEDLLAEWDRIKIYVEIPKNTMRIREKADQMLKEVKSSQAEEMQSALQELDLALKQGDDWEDVNAKSLKITTGTGKELFRAELLEGLIGLEAGLTALKERGSMQSVVSGEPSCVRILSIDGGGIRGIIPAIILAKIEELTEKHIYELFDVIVGTSTGGILALGLTMPDPVDSSKPAYRATKLVNMYKEKGEIIFPQDPLNVARKFFGPEYSPKGIEDVLQYYFNKTRFSDALTNVVVPAYDIEARKHYFFNTYDDLPSPCYMWEVARATSAAPTFFPPFRVPIYPKPSQKDGRTDVALIDGGVFANNPIVYAFSFAKTYEQDLRTKPHDFNHPWLYLSLGTGTLPPSTSYDDAWSLGVIGWLNPLMDIVFSDPGVEDEAKKLMMPGDAYYRFQPEILIESASKLDNSNESNLKELEQIANKYIENNIDKIRDVARKLIIVRPKECRRSVGPLYLH